VRNLLLLATLSLFMAERSRGSQAVQKEVRDRILEHRDLAVERNWPDLYLTVKRAAEAYLVAIHEQSRVSSNDINFDWERHGLGMPGLVVDDQLVDGDRRHSRVRGLSHREHQSWPSPE